MKMKRALAIILATLSLLLLSSCDNIDSKPQKEYGEYPALSGATGYTVTGKITDQRGNPLPGAVITFGDKEKVRGVADKDGEYKITGIEGNVTLIPSFRDYTFDEKEISVSGGGEVNFVGKNSYTTMATARDGNSTLYQMSYIVDGKIYQSKGNSLVYFDNRNGLTRITPQADGFDFEPQYQDVYGGEMVTFTAKPKDGTFSVKGKIDTSKIGKNDEVPSLYITVNGKKYVDVVVNYTYDYNTDEEKMSMSYEVKGLKKGEKYTIAMVDESGNTAAESYTVSEQTNDLNFKLNLTRTFDIRVRPLNTKTKFDDLGKTFEWRCFDYKLYVVDENGTRQDKNYYGDDDFVESVRVWSGCKVYIIGEYYDRANDVHYSVEDWLPISAADIRDVETTELEMTFLFEKYVEEE